MSSSQSAWAHGRVRAGALWCQRAAANGKGRVGGRVSLKSPQSGRTSICTSNTQKRHLHKSRVNIKTLMLYLLSFLSILTLQEPEGSWWGGQEEGKKERGGQTAKEETLLLTEQEGPLNVEAVWAQVGTEFPDTEHFRRERIYGGQSAEVGRVAAKLADPLPDRPGRADPFHGLGANFYSLKIIFLWGRLALGHWSVAFGAHLSWHGDRSWLVRARLAHDKQAGSRQTGWLMTMVAIELG